MFERVLGIVLGPDKIELSQVNRGIKDLEITHCISQSLPFDIKGDRVKEIGTLIQDLCLRHHIQPDVVYSAFYCRTSMFRRIHLPFTDLNKVARVYPYEVEQTLPCSLENVVMDFHVIQSDRASGTDILVAILPKKELEEHLEILKVAGIEPRVITLEPVGLLLLYHAFFYRKNKHVECVIDLNSKKATVILISQDRILLNRQLDLGENERNISELCIEIHLTLTSFMSDSKQPVERIILIGDSILTGEMEKRLVERMGIKTESFNSLKRLPIKLPENGQNKFALLAASLGLCLGKRFKKGEAWNFRQGIYAYQKMYTLPRKKLFTLAFFLILLILLISLDISVRSKHYRNKLRLLDKEAQSVLSQIMPNTKWGPETIALIKKGITQETSVQEQYRGFLDQGPNALDLLRELSTRIPKEYDIIIQEILFQHNKVKIRGRVGTFEMLDKVTKGLNNSKLFETIKIEEANIKGQGNQVSFNLLLELKGH